MAVLTLLAGQQLWFLVSTQLPLVNKQITKLLTVARQRANHSVPAGVGGAAHGFPFRLK